MPLHVTNPSRGTVLVEQGAVASNPWTRLVGLMGRKELPDGDGLLIVRSTSIHTSFMRFPIDVLFMGKDDTVVDMEPAMPPWRARIARGKARYVIELPAGTIEKSDTQVGDRLVVAR